MKDNTQQELKDFLQGLTSNVKTEEELQHEQSVEQAYEYGYETGVLEGHLQMMQLIGTLKPNQIKTISQVVQRSFMAGLESKQ